MRKIVGLALAAGAALAAIAPGAGFKPAHADSGRHLFAKRRSVRSTISEA